MGEVVAPEHCAQAMPGIQGVGARLYAGHPAAEVPANIQEAAPMEGRSGAS
jgi:hypothetical protein